MTVTERAERGFDKLFWGSRVRDTILVLFGAGLAVAPGTVAEYRIAAGVPIAVIGVMGIIQGLRELRKPESQRKASNLY